MEVAAGRAESEEILVLGGATPVAFGMMASAHSVRIMSDTLYKDKPLAVVRETVCNAVDAHIACGQPDLPVEITLDQKSLMVRDFGDGIPPDDFERIYTIYFYSQKGGDKRQTGGFGLGCKAPFSLSDSFTVINRHAGKQYTYAVLLADEDSEGLPVSKLMSTIDTTERGVTVIVPLKQENLSGVSKAIRDVVLMGSIKATLNGKALPTRDYTELRKQGFGLVRGSNEGLRIRTLERIQVLLGNVIYPIENNDAFAEERHELLNRIPSGDTGFVMLLVAEPGTVVPQPSREGLSYNKDTVATLKRLLTATVKKLRPAFDAEFNADITRQIKDSKLTRADMWTFRTTRESFVPKEDIVLDPATIVRSSVRASLADKDIGDARVRKCSNRYFHWERPIQDKARRNGYPNFSPAYDGFDHARRRLIRLMLRAGIPFTRLHYRGSENHWREKVLPFYKTDESVLPWRSYYDREDRKHRLAELRVATRMSDARIDSFKGFFIHWKFPDDASRAAFDELVKQHGFKPVTVAPPEVKPETKIGPDGAIIEVPPKQPRRKRVAGEFFKFKIGKTDRTRYHNHLIQVLGPKTTVKPDAFVAFKFYKGKGEDLDKIDAGMLNRANAGELVDLLTARYPNIVVARNVTEVKELQALGVPLVEELVLRDAMERVKGNDKTQWHYLRIAKMVAYGSLYGRVSSRLPELGRKFADLMTGFPHRPSKAQDDAYVFWRMVTLLLSFKPEFASYKDEDDQGNVIKVLEHAQRENCRGSLQQILDLEDTSEDEEMIATFGVFGDFFVYEHVDGKSVPRYETTIGLDNLMKLMASFAKMRDAKAAKDKAEREAKAAAKLAEALRIEAACDELAKQHEFAPIPVTLTVPDDGASLVVTDPVTAAEISTGAVPLEARPDVAVITDTTPTILEVAPTTPLVVALDLAA